MIAVKPSKVQAVILKAMLPEGHDLLMYWSRPYYKSQEPVYCGVVNAGPTVTSRTFEALLDRGWIAADGYGPHARFNPTRARFTLTPEGRAIAERLTP